MKFVTDYAKDKGLRDSLNELSNEIFGITVLKEDDVHYVPFSFVEDSKTVANVSVGRFHQYINGKRQVAYMIQTVCTLPDYRRQGLIRRLFQHVDEYINAQNGVAFLLANRNLEDFYRQFGFTPVQFASHFEEVPPDVPIRSDGTTKVNLQNPDERKRFREYIRQRGSVSDVYGDIEQDWLFLWYCDHFFGNDIYYILELDVYTVCKSTGECLEIFDVVGQTIPKIEALYSNIGTDSIQKIKYYFTPDKTGSSYKAVIDEQDYFFTRGQFELPAGTFTVPMLARG